ncbi:hypothetical protein [Nocardioides bruguierae]|uniref:Uncharacterized protein n=1 Tax=Nocardioides bruguierae TaxID=2945102 RepID=A0A9X2DAT1_9ACTN|nr:hypothetical protein [Nocardioides bruguierae]MCM0622189.1 hypothetical protein [Nocardioides bruguierae]
MADETPPVRPLTVARLREALADVPEATEVYIETIVGGDLVHADIALMQVTVAGYSDGYFVRLLPDPADNFDTRTLIDRGLAAEEEAEADEHEDEHEDEDQQRLVDTLQARIDAVDALAKEWASHTSHLQPPLSPTYAAQRLHGALHGYTPEEDTP